MVARIGIQFGWNAQSSAYQNIKNQRARVAKFAGQSQSAASSVSSALASASINQVNGANTIAGQKAYDRIQVEMKAALAKAYAKS